MSLDKKNSLPLCMGSVKKLIRNFLVSCKCKIKNISENGPTCPKCGGCLI